MYRVVDWEKHFEVNRTKELKKLSWVPFPNKHDGDGYTALIDHPDGAAHFGCWCAIVQVASKCEPRGTLSRDGARPHDARSLARMTRIPEQLLEVAIARLVSEDVQWLEIVSDEIQCPEDVVDRQLTTMSHSVATLPQSDATTSHRDAALVELNELNGKERTRSTLQKIDHGNGAVELDAVHKYLRAQRSIELKSNADRAQMARMCMIVASGDLPENVLESSLEALRAANGVQKPMAWLHATMSEKCSQAGCGDLTSKLKEIRITKSFYDQAAKGIDLHG